MITAKELNPHAYPTNEELDKNLALLLERLNSARALYGKPFVITSGLRSYADQARINPSAMRSKHLKGLAADVEDHDGALKMWVLNNMQEMEKIGFWFEDFAHTVGWVHFQIVAPASGHRIFIP